jgi:putative FmdB family regulatory protein
LPLYEYQCAKCGRFEVIQKFSDPALAACPTCGGAVEKLLAAPAIQFKGSGWYITDYARKSSGKAEGKPDAGGGDAGKKDGTAATTTATKDAKPSGSGSGSGSGSSGSGSST